MIIESFTKAYGASHEMSEYDMILYPDRLKPEETIICLKIGTEVLHNLDDLQ